MGTSESDAIFNERFDRLGTLDLAIVESLRAQLAVLTLDQPSSITTPDGTSASFSENIKTLQKTLANFIDIGSEGDESLGSSIRQIVRPSYR